MLTVDLAMNAYLFGCLVLLVMWAAALAALRRWRRQDLPEFWWASLSCTLLGFTEPLFVPEYWSPPSVLKWGRWDLESFVFCFAVGGVTAVLPELPAARNLFYEASYRLWLLGRRIAELFRSRLLATAAVARTGSAPFSELKLAQSELTQDNMILVAAFLGAFGTTAHLGLNVIYDTAIACVAMAVFIGWRRPNLRWQILGGGAGFALVYGVVLRIVGAVYPDFYRSHWNLSALSGIWILGAPAEEYLFALTLGLFWAPLYEAWKSASLAPVAAR